MSQNTFAKDLRTHREQAGHTQGQAAAFLSVSLRTVKGWENDPANPPHPLMQEAALARYRAAKASQPSKPAPVAVARPRAGERTRRAVVAPMAKGRAAGAPLFKGSGKLL